MSDVERADVEDLPTITGATPVHKKIAPLFRYIFADIKEPRGWRDIRQRPWAHNPRENRNDPAEWS